MTIIRLPTLHAGQVRIYNGRTRLNAVRCGRRWGKTLDMITMAADGGAKGRKIGLFTPTHKQLLEPYEEIYRILEPIKTRASKNDGTIRTATGGIVDFWQLDDNPLAGRGREYDLAMIDEGAFTKPGQMMGIWQKSIKPTLLTRCGSAWVFSTPNGIDPENFFYQICHDEALGFTQFHAPTSDNPYVPEDELEKERITNPPLVWQQEFEAKFVDWSGVAFFSREKLLVNDQPVPFPKICDSIYLVIDSAVKGGTNHDGTAASFWAKSKHVGYPLVCLDWSVIQVDAALLEHWLPSMLQRGEELAKICRAREGFKGAFVEDAVSGSILIQQAINRNLPVHALPSDLTSAGKDGRAINISSQVHQDKVKFSEYAYNKTMSFKGSERNHMWTQVTGFRIGDKDAHKRSDDLFDTFTYAVAIGLGNSEGFG